MKNTNRANNDFTGLTFEEALAKLNGTVQEMETGGLTLDDATRMFEEGMSLARRCSELLTEAELKISRIKTAYGEQMRLPHGDDDEPGR